METENIKTLKDIEIPCEILDVLTERQSIQLQKDIDESIKAEAIKWVKEGRINPKNIIEIITANPDYFHVRDINKETYYGIELKLVWRFMEDIIKHFFNITEEDLK